MMDQQFGYDDEDGADDDLADPGSLYDDALQVQQGRHDGNEEDALDLSESDDEHNDGEGEGDEGLDNPMELNRASVRVASQTQAEQSEADWLSYISRLSHHAKLDSMKTAMAYIEALKVASLDDECSKLDADTLYQL
jgi:hypothetical protein